MKTVKALLLGLVIFFAYGADKGMQMKKQNKENQVVAVFNSNFSSQDMCEWGANKNFALKINPAYHLACAE